MTKKHLTVLQVLPALQSGGVERGTLEVAHYLVSQGHHSIVMSNGGRLTEQLVREGSTHIQWPIGTKSLLTLRLIPAFIGFLKQHQVDIVHARSRFPAWICYLALRLIPAAQRPKFVTTVHGTYSVSPYSAIMTKGEQVIVVSNMIKEYVLKNYKTNNKPLHLNYRGVNPMAFPHNYTPTAAWLKAWHVEFPETKSKQLLTLPGRITRWKGQEDFIELIAALKQHNPAVHGLIVGETTKDKAPFLAELKAKTQQLGVENHITFINHRADLKDIMAISRIVFSLSHAPEAFGRTTIEALSLGVPVIGYAHGGVYEQLSAILPEGGIAPNNIQAATLLAERWLTQPPVVPKNHRFTLQNMVENTLAVYHQVTATSLPAEVIKRA